MLIKTSVSVGERVKETLEKLSEGSNITEALDGHTGEVRHL